MLSEQQVQEIKAHLDKAQNPVFFFDNDQDGLCSFLILQRYMGRGKGVAVKSFPDLSINYFRKVQELNADYIFILDKPLVSDEFLEEVRKINVPLVWIDHHDVELEVPKFVSYYNPTLETGVNQPVTCLCYQLTQNKEDLWLAVIGSISDSYFPDFYKEFNKKWPELGVKTENPFEVLYNSKIGELARMFSSGLKDTTTNVVSMLKFLIKVKSPYDILEETPQNYRIHKRFEQIDAKYKKLLNKGKKFSKRNFLFFQYSGDLSVSAELSNELMYLFPDKIICVAYVKGNKVNLSMRGKNIKEKLLKAIEGFDNASGGGHKDAVGGQLQEQDLGEFKKRLELLI